MKTTASPWASGLISKGPNTGRPVPPRWQNLTWWDTLVTISLTGGIGGNPFAHMGPAFPMWHRLMLRVLEQVSYRTPCYTLLQYIANCVHMHVTFHICVT